MIKATELRIGNKIKFMGSTLTVSPKTISNLCYTLGEPSQLYEPIPITKEWLLRLGFEEMSGWDDFFYFSIGEFSIFECNEDIYEVLDFQIKHIHQLQNLYFSLCGEELTLKIT